MPVQGEYSQMIRPFKKPEVTLSQGIESATSGATSGIGAFAVRENRPVRFAWRASPLSSNRFEMQDLLRTYKVR